MDAEILIDEVLTKIDDIGELHDDIKTLLKRHGKSLPHPQDLEATMIKLASMIDEIHSDATNIAAEVEETITENEDEE